MTIAGVKSSDVVLVSAHSSDIPKEMISLATVNVAWGALIKTLTNPPSAAYLKCEESRFRMHHFTI